MSELTENVSMLTISGLVPAGRVVRCLFCGHAGPWWECVCRFAVEVRAGKRLKPKTIMRDGVPVIVVDAEVLALNPLGMRVTALTPAECRKIRGLDPEPESANSMGMAETLESGDDAANRASNAEGETANSDANRADSSEMQASGKAVGGRARASMLTPEQRREIASKAAAKRWNREKR